jgi:hypothetical protein
MGEMSAIWWSAYDRTWRFPWGQIAVTIGPLFHLVCGIAAGPRDLVLHLPFFTLAMEWAK